MNDIESDWFMANLINRLLKCPERGKWSIHSVEYATDSLQMMRKYSMDSNEKGFITGNSFCVPEQLNWGPSRRKLLERIGPFVHHWVNILSTVGCPTSVWMVSSPPSGLLAPGQFTCSADADSESSLLALLCPTLPCFINNRVKYSSVCICIRFGKSQRTGELFCSFPLLLPK